MQKAIKEAIADVRRVTDTKVSDRQIFAHMAVGSIVLLVVSKFSLDRLYYRIHGAHTAYDSFFCSLTVYEYQEMLGWTHAYSDYELLKGSFEDLCHVIGKSEKLMLELLG